MRVLGFAVDMGGQGGVRAAARAVAGRDILRATWLALRASFRALHHGRIMVATVDLEIR